MKINTFIFIFLVILLLYTYSSFGCDNYTYNTQDNDDLNI